MEMLTSRNNTTFKAVLYKFLDCAYFLPFSALSMVKLTKYL